MAKGFSFSVKRATGISSIKAKIARETGIPTTADGRRRKAGKALEHGCAPGCGCMVPIIILAVLSAYAAF